MPIIFGLSLGLVSSPMSLLISCFLDLFLIEGERGIEFSTYNTSSPTSPPSSIGFTSHIFMLSC